MNVSFVLLRAMLFASVLAAVTGNSLALAVDDGTEELRYKSFAKKLDTEQFILDYPKAVKNLDSNNTETQETGLMTLAATGEPAAIPFIVPRLDSKNIQVRIYAMYSLQQIVAKQALKRRDGSQPTKVVINPLGPNDTDLRPLAWVITRCYASRMMETHMPMQPR